MLTSMSDLSRHLPLSNRAHGDESRVSGDWKIALSEVVSAAATVVGDDDADAFLSAAGLSQLRGTALGEAAERIRGGRRRRIRDLVDATRALLTVSDVALPPSASGPVALYAATRMPFDRRAAIAGTSFTAEDAGWSFGRGPSRVAPARDILRFVLELSDDLPPVGPRATGQSL